MWGGGDRPLTDGFGASRERGGGKEGAAAAAMSTALLVGGGGGGGRVGAIGKERKDVRWQASPFQRWLAAAGKGKQKGRKSHSVFFLSACLACASSAPA